MNIKFLGLVITTQYDIDKKIEWYKWKAYGDAVKDIIEVCKQKEKIHLAPLVLKGDGQTISDCAFLGTGVEVQRKEA